MKTQKLLAVLFFITTLSFAQPQLAWQSHYNGGSNLTDKAIAIAVDNNCNTYVTGQSDSIGTGTNIVTIKYDMNGMALWRAVYDGPDHLDDIPKAIKIDNNGNVYVCGKTGTSSHGSDWIVIKYSNSGAFDWDSTRNSVTNADDVANDLVVDNNGNVYVSGNVDTKAGVSKYNSSGGTVWNFTSIPGTSAYTNVSNKLALSNTGNVIVMIHENWSTMNDAEFLSLNPANGGSNPFYYLSSITPIDFVLNGSGIAFVLGYYTTSTVEEARIYKYPSTVALYGRSSVNDIQNRNGSIKVDGSNNIYFTTFEDIDTSAAINNQYLTVKTNSTGSLLWLKNYGGSADDQGMFLSLTQGATPNVIVSGYTTNANADKDITFLKYNNIGALQSSFTTSFDMGSVDDIPTGMQLDQYGNVLLSGFSGNFGAEDFTTLKYCTTPLSISSINSDSLYCNSSAASYQWFKNDTLLSGDTLRGIDLTDSTLGNGNYYCVVVQSCCSDTSNTLHMFTVGMSSIENERKVLIYPNPSHDSFVIKNTFKNANLELRIVNTLGNVVHSEKLSSKTEYMVQTNLSAGVYFLQLSDGKNKMIQKLIIE